eukprot:s1596_g15.t1
MASAALLPISWFFFFRLGEMGEMPSTGSVRRHWWVDPSTMKFGLRFAFGLLGTAKALSVDDIFAHGQPQVTSDSSMSLASVAGALANMANQANSSSSTTVQSIKDYISQMLADITTQHNIAQAELTDVSGYTSCDATMTASMGNITTPAPSTTVSTTTMLATIGFPGLALGKGALTWQILTTTLAPTSAELEQCLAEIQTINTSVITCESEAEAAKMASDAVCANFHYQPLGFRRHKSMWFAVE